VTNLPSASAPDGVVYGAVGQGGGVAMSWYAEAMRRVGRTRWFAAVGSRLAPPLDRLLHRVSGGRLHVAESFLPTLLLTTTGRRSGEPRAKPLAYVRDGSAFVVVGTNWGDTSHPAWTHNLRAEPHAVVEARGERYDVIARELDADAAARLWPRFLEMWPAYATYRERTSRAPRMFALHPAGVSPPAEPR
jgi:deazaflavin-dependent oxidoreductase (nitroreductase family)